MEWIIVAIISIITQLITGLFIIIKKIIKHNNNAKHKNINIFGNQTINNEQDEKKELNNHTKIKTLKAQIFELHEMVIVVSDQNRALAKALAIYVKNNGADATTKKIIGELLDEKNFTMI